MQTQITACQQGLENKPNIREEDTSQTKRDEQEEVDAVFNNTKPHALNNCKSQEPVTQACEKRHRTDTVEDTYPPTVPQHAKKASVKGHH